MVDSQITPHPFSYSNSCSFAWVLHIHRCWLSENITKRRCLVEIHLVWSCAITESVQHHQNILNTNYRVQLEITGELPFRACWASIVPQRLSCWFSSWFLGFVFGIFGGFCVAVCFDVFWCLGTTTETHSWVRFYLITRRWVGNTSSRARQEKLHMLGNHLWYSLQYLHFYSLTLLWLCSGTQRLLLFQPPTKHAVTHPLK